ncbi:MAG: acyl-CoA dehydrogenase family protein [Cephaloticoccus sp.]|nr:acyl-CoA dehydrogenase family protein [Cephaloticoccus sp.]MCF7761220.1 acyl-CoA dehydrogenase family protein [Cephaloticoccus sp.]
MSDSNATKKTDEGSSVIDMSKMNQGQRAALEITEAARESHDDISFAAHLFMGRFRPDKLHPVTEVDGAEFDRAKKFLTELGDFLQARVDADAIDRTGEIPDEVMAGLAKLGAYGIKVPQEYGGLGFSQTTYCRACQLIASHCMNIFAHISVHQSVGVSQPLVLFGTPEQKQKFLPRVAGGELSAFALTEPGVGSDPARMKTLAEPDGDDFLITGEKLWCSNGTRAKLLIVAAQTPPKVINGKTRTQITTFVVEANSPGIEMVHRCQFMGLHALYNAVMRFTKVRVPKANIVGGEGRGLKVALSTLNAGRLSIPASSLGMAKKSLAIAREWGGERIQWGVPIGQHAAVADKIRRIASHAFAMEAMLLTTSRIVDRDKQADIRLEASMCKMWGTEKAWMCLDDVMQIRGGRGYENVESLKARGEKPHPVERMMRDNRVATIFEGSSEIMRLFIMREALDPHLKIAGVALNTERPWRERLRSAVKSAGFYAFWYPRQWLPFGCTMPADLHPHLVSHLRTVERLARRMARTLFHQMVIFGPKLEKRQVLLGRIADIGSDLFALGASCVYAQKLLKEGEAEAKVLALVDDFAAQALLRIDGNFRGVGHNADQRGYELAQQIVAGEHAWLEQGIL